MEGVNRGDGLAIKLDHNIPIAQACFRSRPVGSHGNGKHAAGGRQLVVAYDPAVNRDILTPNPDIAAPYSAFFNQPTGNKFCCVDTNGKTDALCGENYGGIDTYDLATRI